ncbi:magnesium chelatase domain-containing protein [Neobacillus drentensis]|uniref:magnesium chelatase domain-containing protein n=1 Tax=Neobacillus drentensis TaxID=220684 RepID=UPI002FFDB4DD
MWARVSSIGLKGMEGYRVNVEVGTYIGTDSFKIVGLPDAAVKEAKERIIAALRSLGVYLIRSKNYNQSVAGRSKEIWPDV